MPLSLEEKGKIFAMGHEVQNEINKLDERRDELIQLVKRIINLQGKEPHDEFGEPLIPEEITRRSKKAVEEFKRCIPGIDLSKTNTTESLE